MDRIYQHTVVYECATREAMSKFAQNLIDKGWWFSARPHDLTIETSEVMKPMKGVRVAEARTDTP